MRTDAVTGSAMRLVDSADGKRFVVDVGVSVGIKPDTIMRVGYTGSFGDLTSIHGGSLSFKFSDLNTELTMNYANAFDGSKPSSGDFNAFFGVNIRY